MVLPNQRDDVAPHRSGQRGGRRRSPLRSLNIRPTLFESRVRYKNELLLPRDFYPQFKVPTGLPVWEPLYVTARKMQQLAPQKTLAVVAGLTTAKFSMSFADLGGQWRRKMRGSMTVWEFQGGTVYLDVEIGIYIQEGFRPLSKNDSGYFAGQEKLFTVILEHEYLHVKDEVDVVRTFMPPKVRLDGQIISKLIRRQALLDREFHHWIRKRNAEGRTGLEQWVFNDWAHEHNRRANARDSGPEWTRYRNRIDTMMQGQPDPGP